MAAAQISLPNHGRLVGQREFGCSTVPSVQTAFDRLRRYARAHRHRLSDVAHQVVAGDAADAVLTHVRRGPEPPSILDP